MPTDTPPRRHWLERTPSWAILAILPGLILLCVVLSLLFPQTFWHPPSPAMEVEDPRCGTYHQEANWLRGGLYDESHFGFFYDYIWLPILCDEGYNLVNTINLAVVLAIMLLWAYRLMAEVGERVDTGLVFAVVPYLVWGSIYRVLEDSDLFASWSDTPAGPAGDGFLDHYLGVFFITPIIYVEITFLAVALLMWGHRAKRASETLGLGHGLKYYLLSLVVMVSLYSAWWASGPTYVRHVADPWIIILCAATSYWIVHARTLVRGRFSAHLALGSYGVLFLLVGLYYVLHWMTGGIGDWKPDVANPETLGYPLPLENNLTGWPLQWWVFGAMVIGPGLLCWAIYRLGRTLAGVRGPRVASVPANAYGGPALLLIILGILAALAAFATIVGLRDLGQRELAGDWTGTQINYLYAGVAIAMGPLAVWLLPKVAHALAPGIGTHPAIIAFTSPINLLLVFGQACDAMMTSLGLDMFNYSEKHILPEWLIERSDSMAWPGALDAFPAALVFIPLKVLIVLGVVVAIDLVSEKETDVRGNLVNLVKLGIVMVGLSPGVRDAVRLAMST